MATPLNVAKTRKPAVRRPDEGLAIGKCGRHSDHETLASANGESMIDALDSVKANADVQVTMTAVGRYLPVQLDTSVGSVGDFG